MQVVLPELDGRLLTAAISFKRRAGRPHASHARPRRHRACRRPGRRLGRLRATRSPNAGSRSCSATIPALGGQRGHAVGLDRFASLAAITGRCWPGGLRHPAASTGGDSPTGSVTPPHALPRLAEYAACSPPCPPPLQDAASSAWGDPADDPSVQDGHFTLRHLRLGNAHRRPAARPRRAGRPPRRLPRRGPAAPARLHRFLPVVAHAHALVHLGTHGSLEWLPGKAAALSPLCWPRALIGGLPVIYPFIVNNPGEAAAAKRRLGAVTIGHLTPPIRPAGLHGEAAALEQMIDEYAAADGMDRRRTALLRRDILDRAASAGLLDESGVPRQPDDDALARLDAYLCDVKDLQIRDGLHVFGQPPDADRLALLPPGADALRAGRTRRPARRAGRPVRAARPGGRALRRAGGRAADRAQPRRGRPAHAAHPLRRDAGRARGRRPAAPPPAGPRRLAALRGAERVGQPPPCARGARISRWRCCCWACAGVGRGSARVNGFTVTRSPNWTGPASTSRCASPGLFRDAFAAQVTLFDAAAAAVAARDEAPDWNPLAGQPGPRVFGPAPGQYGVAGRTGSPPPPPATARSDGAPTRRPWPAGAGGRRLPARAGPCRDRPAGRPGIRRPSRRVRRRGAALGARPGALPPRRRRPHASRSRSRASSAGGPPTRSGSPA